MVTVGKGLTVTVTVFVFVQPFASVPVTVYVVVEVGFAVTMAPVVADKPVAGLHVYVEAPDAVRETLPPIQIAGAEGVTVIVGFGFTVTVTVAVFTQPLALVPETVYVVVVVGPAVTVAPVVPDNPVDGLHEYVEAPDAVSDTLLPLQIVGADGVTLTVGKGFTVTVTFFVLTHPFASVPVTVYVVVDVGFAVTVAPVVGDKPVAGLHVYVDAPDAVRETLAPIQIAGADGVTAIVGNTFTVKVTIDDVTDPHAPVTIT